MIRIQIQIYKIVGQKYTVSLDVYRLRPLFVLFDSFVERPLIFYHLRLHSVKCYERSKVIFNSNDLNF